MRRIKKDPTKKYICQLTQFGCKCIWTDNIWTFDTHKKSNTHLHAIEKKRKLRKSCTRTCTCLCSIGTFLVFLKSTENIFLVRLMNNTNSKRVSKNIIFKICTHLYNPVTVMIFRKTKFIKLFLRYYLCIPILINDSAVERYGFWLRL